MWSKLFGPLDKLLDGFSMYRLLPYCLLVLVGTSSVLGSLGLLPYSGLEILISASVLVCASFASNRLFSRIIGVSANKESDLISGLILSLIMTPVSSPRGLLVLVAVATVAMGSKFLLVWGNRHVFNPAALGAFSAGLIFNNYASWWVGTPRLLPVALVASILILRRIQRAQMALVFGAVFMATLAVTHHATFFHTAQLSLTHSAIVFLAGVMLTEPMSAPKNKPGYLSYAAFVALLCATPQMGLSHLSLAPEAALLVANIYTLIAFPSRRVVLRLAGKKKEAQDVYSFSFRSEKKFNFKAGQYMEWSVHHHPSDSKGTRRFLTISSSPTEDNLEIALKISEPASSFKRALVAMHEGDEIQASELAGSFTLPKDRKQKLAFIAGGIGVTPYHSMVKQLLDANDQRDACLLYSASNPSQFAFTNLFRSAQKIGLKASYTVTGSKPDGWNGYNGRINSAMIRSIMPDYAHRTFYLSGSLGFVQLVREQLKDLGVSNRRIRKDYFPGYE